MSKIENSKKLLQKNFKEKYNKLKFLLKDFLNSFLKYIFKILKENTLFKSNG